MEGYISDMKGLLGDAQTPKLWEAARYADKLHKGQRRKSGEPYIVHPCAVVRILVEEFGLKDPPTLVAAMLHDLVEDVDEVTTDILKKKFGQETAGIVEGCTKIKSSSNDPKALQPLFHQKLFTHAVNQGAVLLVKLADRLHNIRTLKHLPARKRQKIADETLSIYAPLAKIMGMYLLKRELYYHALKFRFPRKSQKILRHISQIEKSEEVRQTQERLQSVLDLQGFEAEVRPRAKNLGSYYDPANQSLLFENNPGNPVDFAVIARTVQDCYQILGVINQTFPPNPRSLRDFIASPKANGYQSLHVRADVAGTFYLFKIRTKDMDWLARYGVIADLIGGTKTGKEFYGDISELLEYFAAESKADYKEAIDASGKDVLFTYTPNGDVIQMPAGSVVLDFAYRVHSQLGDTCYGAIVDGKRVPCDFPLKDGVRVKVLSSSRRVNEIAITDEKKCKTPKARLRTRRKINQLRRKFAEKIGRSLFQQALNKQSLSEKILDNPSVQSISNAFQAASRNELWYKIGIDSVNVWDVAGQIAKAVKKDFSLEVEQNRLTIDKLDPLCIKLANCCHPYPGEETVVGLLSERGLSVHRDACSELERYHVKTRDMVIIDWDPDLDIAGMDWTVFLCCDSQVKLLNALSTASEMTDNIIELYCIRHIDKAGHCHHMKGGGAMEGFQTDLRAPDIMALRDYMELLRKNIDMVVITPYEELA